MDVYAKQRRSHRCYAVGSFFILYAKKREALGVSPSQNTSRKYEPHAHWGEARKRCTVDVYQSGEDRPYSHRECEIHPSLLFLPVFPRLCPLGDSGADENTDCGKNSSTDR